MHQYGFVLAIGALGLGVGTAAPAWGAAQLDYRLSSSSTLLQAADATGAFDANLQQDDGDVFSVPSAGSGLADYSFGGFATTSVASSPDVSGASGQAQSASGFTGVSGNTFTGFTFEADARSTARRNASTFSAIGRGFADTDHNVFFTLTEAHDYTIDLSGYISAAFTGGTSVQAIVFVELRQSVYNPATGESTFGTLYESDWSSVLTSGSELIDLSESGTLQAGTYWFRVANSVAATIAGTHPASSTGSTEAVIDSGSFTLTPVPEPGTLALLAAATGAGLLRRRR